MIHLAKITLLEASCEHFAGVHIPESVYGEVMMGVEKGYPDAGLISGLVKAGKIHVKTAIKKELIRKAESFNIFGGEAEAVALYWQEKADLLATDDDNVRKKQTILKLNVIGTPIIMLGLYRNKKMTREKFHAGIMELKKIGWFSSTVIDKLLIEAK